MRWSLSSNEQAVAFQQNGFVELSLERFMSRHADAVRRISELDDADWSFIVRSRNGQVDLPGREVRRARVLHRKAERDAAEGLFSFSFRRLTEGCRNGREAFTELRDAFGSEAMRRLLEQASGRAIGDLTLFYISWFDRGSFLGVHCDPGQSIALVVNLTTCWAPAFGGITHILSDDRARILHSIVPACHTALILETGQRSVPHYVSAVAVAPPCRRLALVARYAYP